MTSTTLALFQSFIEGPLLIDRQKDYVYLTGTARKGKRFFGSGQENPLSCISFRAYPCLSESDAQAGEPWSIPNSSFLIGALGSLLTCVRCEARFRRSMVAFWRSGIRAHP